LVHASSSEDHLGNLDAVLELVGWLHHQRHKCHFCRPEIFHQTWTYLVHPEDTQGYIINRDESGKATGAVLMMEDKSGHISNVSTTSYVRTI
jgi:hypothetical protein